MSPLVARVLAKRRAPDERGCRLWTASCDGNGRPQVRSRGKTLRASRVVLEHKLGRPLRSGECACHTCDVPTCLNEDHLFAGTHSDNMRDMAAKGRQALQVDVSRRQFGDANPSRRLNHLLPHGDDHWTRVTPERVPTGDEHWSRRMPGRRARGEAFANAKLTAEIAAEILRSNEPQRVLARRYGVSQRTILNIKKRRAWAHVRLAADGSFVVAKKSSDGGSL